MSLVRRLVAPILRDNNIYARTAVDSAPADDDRDLLVYGDAETAISGAWGYWGSSIARVTDDVHSGTYSTKVVTYNPTYAANRQGLIWYSEYSGGVYATVPANTPIVSTLWFKGVAGVVYRFSGRVINSTGGYLSEGQGLVVFTATGDWQRLETPRWTYSGGEFAPCMQVITEASAETSGGFPFWADEVETRAASYRIVTAVRRPEELASDPRWDAKVVVVARADDVGTIHTRLAALGYTDVTIDTTITTLAGLAGYDVVVEDSSHWALTKASLLQQAYAAGYSVLTTANDTNASQLPFATSSQAQTGFGLTPSGSPLYPAQGWTTTGTFDTDSGVIITGIRSTAYPLATHPTSTGGLTGYTAIAEEDPGGSGGRWVHIQPSSPTLAGSAQGLVLLRRSMEWLYWRSTEIGDSVTRLAFLPRTASESAPASDAVTDTFFAYRTASDSSPASDAATRTTSYGRSVAEDVSGTDDTATRLANRGRSASDDGGTGTTDTVVDTAILIRSVGDSAPASDAITTDFATLYRTVGDTAPAADDSNRPGSVFARGAVDFASLGANLVSDFDQWQLTGGAYLDPLTDELVFTAYGQSAISPIVPIEALDATWWWSAEYFSSSGGSTTWPGAGGTSTSSLYFDAAGASTTNSSGYTGNGNAQTFPHGAWTRMGWAYLAGAGVRGLRIVINHASTYTPPSFRVRNPQISTVAGVGYTFQPHGGSLSDVAVRGFSGTRALVDLTPADDDVTETFYAFRTGSDTASVSDAIADSALLIRTSADDASGTTDALGDVYIARRAPSEDITGLGDAAVRALVLPRGGSDSLADPGDDGDSDTVAVRTGSEAIDEPTDLTERAGTFGRTPADSAPVVSDAPAQNSSQVRTSADTAPVTDAATQNSSQVRASVDTADATDVATRVGSAFARTPEDTAPADDTPTSASTHPRTGADSVAGISDAPTVAFSGSRDATDSAPANDDGSRETSTFFRSTANNISTIPDTAKRTNGFFSRDGADDAPADDEADRSTVFPRTADDTVFLDDSAVGASLHPRTSDDDAPADDDPTSRAVANRAVVEGSTYVGDVAGSGALIARYGTDTVLINLDVATQQSQQFRAVSDDASGATDGATQNTSQSRDAADGLPGPGDAASVLSSHYRTSDDTAFFFGDEVSETVFFTRNVGDAAGATDSAERYAERARTATDDISGTGDGAVRDAGLFSRDVPDSAPAADSVSRAQSIGRVVEEALDPVIDALLTVHGKIGTGAEFIDGLTDEASRSFTGARQITDDGSITESLGSIPIRVRSATDSAPTSGDAATRAGVPFLRVQIDDAPASDDGSRTPSIFARASEESDTVTDAVVRGASYRRTPTEDVTVTDAVTHGTLILRTGFDTAQADDSSSSFAHLERIGEDILPATEVTSTEARLFRRVAEDVAEPVDTPIRVIGIERFGLDETVLSEEAGSTTYHLRAQAEFIPPPVETLLSVAVVVRLAADAVDPVADDLARIVRQVRLLTEDVGVEEDLLSRALQYRTSSDDAGGLGDGAVREILLFRAAEDEVPEVEEFMGRIASLFRRTADDILDPDDWAYARIGEDYRIVPRVRVLSVSREKVSLRDGYDSAVVHFYFDLPVIEWTVRLNSTSHLDGDLVEAWAAHPPTQYGSVTVPAALLRRGANRLTIYGRSLGGIWTR